MDKIEWHFGEHPPIRWDDVEILIVGSGTMGALLAQAYAQNGVNVGLVGRREESIQHAFALINRELEDARNKGIFSATQVAEIKNRILATTNYEQACRGECLKLALETATEDIQIKKQIFQTLDKLCPSHVALATNTSCLDANILARDTKRPDKVIWMHYFSPPHKNHAGEYAGTENASPQSIELAAQFMKRARKVATPLLKYRKGGAANVIFVALLLEAARMIDEKFDFLALEAASQKAFNLPQGFLSLMAAVGMSLAHSCLNSFSDASNPSDPLYQAYNNFFLPPPGYRKMFEASQGGLGKPIPRWGSDADVHNKPHDWMLVDTLKNRFLAVAFMTSVELVDSGIIRLEEVDQLCQNAFQWQEGPFTLMNRIGILESMRLVTEKMEISHRKEINFPIPKLLIEQVQKNEPWKI
jgi:3-hydroxybutyryl-CoA dehydrogenase